MTVTADDCVICELERTLRARSGEIRRELQVMNPVTDPYYAGTFQVLVEVDRDLGVLMGRFRKQRNAT
jgi:hypothetical protein